MKIRIKKTKQIDEISAVASVGPMGYAGGFKEKEELQEDGEGQGAHTYGASRSVGNKNIRKPYYDEEEPVHDDQKTFNGLKQRNAHNPKPNIAIDTQGKLLGEEEEDLDESMMTLLATATEPEAGSGHTAFDGESDIGDWDFWAVKKRRAQRTLNRAFYPEMEHDEMFAHIHESIDDDDDMDSVDREFFANASTSIEADPLAGLSNADAAKRALEDKGYTIESQLGKGQWGTVYKAKNNFKQPCAVKVVTGEGADRELSNYQTIGAARSANKLIAKHFPNVMEAWSPRDGIAVIAMELLEPLNDAQATFLPDASYLAGKNKPHRLAAASQSYHGMRDMSQRFTHFIQNNIQEVSAMFDARVYTLTMDWRGDYLGKMTEERMEDAKSNVSPESLLQIIKIEAAAPEMSKQYFNNRKASMQRILGAGSDAISFMEILEEESPDSLGANAALSEIAFRIMLVGLMAQVGKGEIDAEIGAFAKNFLRDARQFTQIPSAYEVPSINMPQRGHERRFLTSKGLHSAIKALYDQTGLIAKDVDDSNIMSRPNGDVVIVDVGLFRPDSGWSPSNNLQEMLRIRKKMLRNLQK
jgi:serine/threonine protein kinase